eukprot:310040_1
MESFISPTRGDWASRDLPEIPHPIHQSPHFRAVRHKSVIERVEERAQRRDQAIQDLLHSESQYNVLLGLLIHHYVSPLSDHKLINSKQHKTLFPALHSIKDLSDKFLHELRQRRKKWLPNVTKLSDLFETFTPFFRMYQHHVNNQEKALDLLSQLSQNKRWIVFCQKAQIHCQRMPLSDLLILPSEQLVAYDETLIRIVESTSPHHPDYSDLVKSQESLHHEVESMKLKMIEYNRKENVRKIERRLKGKIDLLEPHRAFICEGKLWKISARSRKDRIYTFFLFNDLLIYASAFGNKYKIHNMLPMNDKFAAEMIVTSASYGIDKKDRIFCIKSEKKSIVVYADTVPLAQQWVTQLNECCKQRLTSVQPPAHTPSSTPQFLRIQQIEQEQHPRYTRSISAAKSAFAEESLSEIKLLQTRVPDRYKRLNHEAKEEENAEEDQFEHLLMRDFDFWSILELEEVIDALNDELSGNERISKNKLMMYVESNRLNRNRLKNMKQFEWLHIMEACDIKATIGIAIFYRLKVLLWLKRWRNTSEVQEVINEELLYVLLKFVLPINNVNADTIIQYVYTLEKNKFITRLKDECGIKRGIAVKIYCGLNNNYEWMAQIVEMVDQSILNDMNAPKLNEEIKPKTEDYNPNGDEARQGVQLLLMNENIHAYHAKEYPNAPWQCAFCATWNTPDQKLCPVCVLPESPTQTMGVDSIDAKEDSESEV